MRATTRIIVILAILLLSFLSIRGFAQSDQANPAAFGIGFPEKVTDLPQGAFRTHLQSLPPQSRGKALQTLRKFQFTEHDLPYIKVDAQGGVYFADVFLQEAANEIATGDIPVAESITESEIFLLHSRPGAANRIYLDFDGHIITGTAWNSGGNTLYAKPYGSEADDTVIQTCSLPDTLPIHTVNFSATDLAGIGEIWHRTAEDFAAFDVDVTTENPGTFDRYTGRLLYTQDVDYCGQNMPSCCSAGGVAYVGVFGNSIYHSYYSPALVYFNKLGSVQSRHEAGSHEMGHNLSLGHDGTGSTSYYLGHGSSDTSPVDLNSWAPIMGAGYYRNVTQWSKGDYPGAVLYGQGGYYQASTDDIAAIAAYLGYRTDDHGNTIGTATGLTVQGNGTIAVTNPETDPHEFSPENKGVIEDRNDLDIFYFDTGAGAVNITIEPAWAAFYRSTTRRGANLDIGATLMDSEATVLDADEPSDDTNAILSATVAAGRYYVSVDGVGNLGNTNDASNENYGYDDYGSTGMYFISGTVQPTSSDTDPPTPDPMTWAVEPYSAGSSSIGMTATTAADITGPIQYNFTCVSGGGGCTPSGWQTSISHTATGLDAATEYTYTVQARDAVLNLTAVSAQKSDTTDPPPPSVPTDFSATAVSQTQINLGWTDASGDEDGFNLRRSTDQSNWTSLPDAAANATSHNDNGLAAGTQYFYQVRSFSNSDGASTWVSANASTLQDPPDGTPSGLTATAASTSQINLAWTDQAENASSFEVERSADGSSGWSNIGSVSPGVQAFSSTGLSSGATWYYRVGAYTTGGINYSNVDSATTDFECTSGPVTPAVNTWVMFALPCMPADNTVGAIVPLPDADYGGRWVVYYYNNDPNGSSPGYELLQLTSPMLEGMGYFFFSKDPVTLTIEGANNNGTDIDLRTDSANGAFNLVGMPRNGLTEWPGVFVMNGSNPVSLANADKKTGGIHRCDQTPPHSQCLMSRKMHKWNGVAYDVFDGESPMFGELDPFNVVWVKAFKSGVKLRIPAPAAGPAEGLAASGAGGNTGNKGKSSKDKGKPQPWHIRLIAESGSHADRGNFLGQQKGASDGQDPRDLEEPSPFGGKYLSVLFTNPDFAPVNWGYTSDFRELTGRPQGEWTFVVRASAEFGQVTLRWEGAADLFDNAVLIDEQTGETIAAQAGGSYTFSMVSGENHFSFVLP